MDFLDILLAQLSDPFRIGLLVMLMLTAANTAAQVGTVVPLVLGVIFVAVLIPTAFETRETGTASAIGIGLVANAIVLGILLALKALWTRISARKSG